MLCGKGYGLETVQRAKGVPYCDCGGIIKPDVVLYEEGLDESVLRRAVEHIRAADLLIVGGTSLSVYPAAGLIQYFRGSRLVLINKSPTAYDGEAALLIPEKIGEVFSTL